MITLSSYRFNWGKVLKYVKLVFLAAVWKLPYCRKPWLRTEQNDGMPSILFQLVIFIGDYAFVAGNKMH